MPKEPLKNGCQKFSIDVNIVSIESKRGGVFVDVGLKNNMYWEG